MIKIKIKSRGIINAIFYQIKKKNDCVIGMPEIYGESSTSV